MLSTSVDIPSMPDILAISTFSDDKVVKFKDTFNSSKSDICRIILYTFLCKFIYFKHKLQATSEVR